MIGASRTPDVKSSVSVIIVSICIETLFKSLLTRGFKLRTIPTGKYSISGIKINQKCRVFCCG